VKKYNYQDHFEMVYLRHEYARRCKEFDGKYVKEFAGVIHTTAKIMYEKLYPNFSKVGFDRDDIVNIASLYVLYYMELYSLRNNAQLRNRYVQKYIKRTGSSPTEAVIANHDRNNLIGFLRQKILHVSTLCSRKARNITVGKDKKAAFAATEKSIPVSNDSLFKNYKKYGYRKVTQNELKRIKKLTKERNDQVLVDKDGFKVIEVQSLNNGISYQDYDILFNNSNKNIYTENPEEVFSRLQEDSEMEVYREVFNKKNQSYKRKKLMDFIKQNKNKKYLKKELTLAKKLLLNKQIMV